MPRFAPSDIAFGKSLVNQSELRGAIRFASIVDHTTAPEASVEILKGTGAQKLVSRWGVFRSNKVKTSVFAGFANGTIAAGSMTGELVDYTDANVLVDYAVASGYDDKDPNTDVGVTVAAALEYWRTEGIMDYRGKVGHIAGYAMLKPRNLDELAAAIRAVGWVGIGVKVYKRAASWYRNQGAVGFQEDLPPVWDLDMKGGIAGHVFVPVVGVDEDGNLLAVLWGQIQRISPEYYSKNSDEAWAVFTYDFVMSDTSNPGIKTAQLARTIGRKTPSAEGPKLETRKGGVVVRIVDGVETVVPSTSKASKTTTSPDGATVAGGASDAESDSDYQTPAENVTPTNTDVASTANIAESVPDVETLTFSH